MEALESGDQSEPAHLARVVGLIEQSAAEDWQGFGRLGELLLQVSACCGWLQREAPTEECECRCASGESAAEEVAVLGLQALAASGTRHQV